MIYLCLARNPCFVLCLTSLFVCGCGSGTTSQDDEPVTLPAIDEIAEIRAEVYNSAFLPDCPEFSVPPEHWKALLDKFHPIKRSDLRHRLDETGTLKIKHKKGGLILVHWYHNGQNSLEFVINGQRCVRGEYETGTDEGLNMEGYIWRLKNGPLSK